MEKLLIVTSNDKKNIYKHYAVTETDVKESVDIIKTWLQKLPHLPQNYTDDFINAVLLRNKFQTERTKQKLDSYYTIRGQNIELLLNLETVVPSQSSMLYIPMPKLTPNAERIIVIKVVKPISSDYNLLNDLKLVLAVQELGLHYDYYIGVRYLIDLQNFTLQHLTKLNPLLLQRTLSITQGALSQRLLGIEMINSSSVTEKLMVLLRLILRSKFHNRIRFHQNLESLFKVIPKECIPENYGGAGIEINNLLNKWDEAMQAHQDFFKENCKNISVEKLRPFNSNNVDSHSINGTFKKLNVD